MKFRRMNIATNGQAYTGQYTCDKTLSKRPGVKDNDWIIFLEYDALQVNYVKRSSFDFVTHLEFSSLALQI
jgi:hypothetical protein